MGDSEVETEVDPGDDEAVETEVDPRGGVARRRGPGHSQ